MATFLYPPVSVTTLPPTGGATSANQLLMLAELEQINDNTLATDAGIQATKTKLDSIISIIAQKEASEVIFFDYSGVSNAGYTQLIGSTTEDTRSFTWFESSGQPMIVAIGAPGSEVDLFAVPPGGFNGEIPIFIPQGSRVSIKQLNAETLGTGIFITANLLK